jgi:HIRAN domain
LTLLGRSEGLRGTGSLTVFPLPKSKDGAYHVYFFSHGLRHLPYYAVQAVEELRPGSRLFLMPNPQNRQDSSAVALRTDDPITIVGYCPRYLSKDFLFLLKSGTSDIPEVVVERVNQDAPIQLRLLCSMRTPGQKASSPAEGRSMRYSLDKSVIGTLFEG